MIRYLTVTDVAEIHDVVLEASGGKAGILKPEGLESAVLAVQASYGGTLVLATLADVASAYCYHLVTGYVFVDGNKRTSLASAAAFLDVNGHPIEIDERWVDLMVAVAERKVTREQLAEFFATAMGTWGEIEP